MIVVVENKQIWLQHTNYLLQKSTSGTIRTIRPAQWQQGVKQIDPYLILPSELGGSDDNKHRAWYGDKVLGAHVARFTMTFFQDSLDRQVASTIASIALSNRFLHEKFPTIVPKDKLYHGTVPQDEFYHGNEAMAGTAVEAAVSRMSERKIDDLSQYLVKEAINEIIRNAK